MMVLARAVSLSLLVLLACTSETSDSTTTTASTTTTTTADPSSGAASDTTAGPVTTTTDDATTTIADECPSRPAGAYNSCEKNGFTDNKLCGWTNDGGPQGITCLTPQSGGFNICALTDCVDDCDCFTHPTTGTAIAGCREVFGGGGKACVLYCLNGQVCPDGMGCSGGLCYWPN